MDWGKQNKTGNRSIWWRPLFPDVWPREGAAGHELKQGSSNPGLRTGTGLRPVSNRAARQEAGGRWASGGASRVSPAPRHHLASAADRQALESQGAQVPGATKIGDGGAKGPSVPQEVL